MLQTGISCHHIQTRVSYLPAHFCCPCVTVNNQQCLTNNTAPKFKMGEKCKRLEEKGDETRDWQGSLRSLPRRPLHLYPPLSSTHKDWVCFRNQSHSFALLTQLLLSEHSQKTNTSSSHLLFCQFSSNL